MCIRGSMAAFHLWLCRICSSLIQRRLRRAGLPAQERARVAWSSERFAPDPEPSSALCTIRPKFQSGHGHPSACLLPGARNASMRYAHVGPQRRVAIPRQFFFSSTCSGYGEMSVHSGIGGINASQFVFELHACMCGGPCRWRAYAG
jgi:hypothetical protein